MERAVFKNHQLLASIFSAFMMCIILGGKCSSRRKSPDQPATATTIFTIFGSNNGVVSYSHLILVPQFIKGEVDSSEAMQVIKGYLDTVHNNKPISSIQIFNSIANYDPGESISQPRAFHKACVVAIQLDTNSLKPLSFRFYNDLGYPKYNGIRWNP